MIAFEVTSPELVEKLLLRTELISFAESLGGVETLMTFPAVQTHADIEPAKRVKLGHQQPPAEAFCRDRKYRRPDCRSAAGICSGGIA